MKNKLLEKYSFPMRFMHNFSAILFILTFILGFFLSRKIIPSEYFNLHKSFGISVFVLVIIRVLIRIQTKKIPEVFSKNKMEKILVKSVHFGLYGCLFLMPLTGYFMSSFYAGKNGSVNFFNFFKISFFTNQNKEIVSFFSSSHEIISYIALILIGFHIAGSFKHLIFERINIFKKIIP